jgi:hypothetical protein
LRLDAAKAAIGYEKPRLAAVDGRVDANLSWASIVEEVAAERIAAMKAIEGNAHGRESWA